VWILTATGNPVAVERSAREAGFDVAGRTLFRDHHWFRRGEVTAAREAAERAGAKLLLTSKDAVRWPDGVEERGAGVLPVTWQWVEGGEALESRLLAVPADSAALAGARG
jgi:tetraacyldisaccharide 4'-kinase